MVGFGVSIFLITLGAIFKWAIKAHLSGIDLPALGVILMVVGAASFLLQLVMMSRTRAPRGNPEVINDDRNQPPV
ncbi:DUF6458 family protein [Actinoallomurus iriomotensis]|jgi:Domain of unknown function (DUF6458)|uniref:DUF6458 domain-containing protein n=2 Tax=Actinoallomurus iriomotensis TaxID=478107 RepID=A0A9W6VT17_9ACTN|nr:DUF6458 family protein [Actinoallomurus iriomotensis]GLY78669.1 hypothetical protein Airi01_069360 [Actinoallomurus iriomotensis]GLY90951.1 hypothetical protein Airi02_088800 [Actinoallomurus iriomotensis]